MQFIVKALPVRCGDCFVIRFSDHDLALVHHIIIDAGYANTYHRTLKPIIQQLVDEGAEVDLFVLTHTDGDHIGGTRPLIANLGVDLFKKIWFNYAPVSYIIKEATDEVSIKQGITLRNYLLESGKVNAEPILSGHTEKIGNGIITVLSPDKEQFDRFITEWQKEEPFAGEGTTIAATGSDYGDSVKDLIHNVYEPDLSWSNRSSIAFIIQIGSIQALFAGDAHAEVLISALTGKGYTSEKPIKLQLMKVAHHGSKSNTSNELMRLIDCQHFLISSNDSNKHHFPHKEALSRIVLSAHHRRPEEVIHLYFTYNSSILKDIFTLEEQRLFNLICHYPDTDTEGITITSFIDE